MPPRRTKFVTLKISSIHLKKFPALTSHQQEKKPKIKLTLKLGNSGAADKKINNKSDSVLPDLDLTSRESSVKPTPHDSQSPGISNQNKNDSSKLSSNIRVGVSGLSMNPSIIRELDTSPNVTSKWSKYNENIKSESTKQKTNELQAVKDKNKVVKVSKFDIPELQDLDNVHGVLSMKDLRGYKEHINKSKQNKIIEKAQQNGRRVFRSFSGYLMLYPSWHKIKQGCLERKNEYTNEKPNSQSKSNTSKNAKNTSAKSSVAPDSLTVTATPSEISTPVPSNVSKGSSITVEN